MGQRAPATCALQSLGRASESSGAVESNSMRHVGRTTVSRGNATTEQVLKRTSGGVKHRVQFGSDDLPNPHSRTPSFPIHCLVLVLRFS